MPTSSKLESKFTLGVGLTGIDPKKASKELNAIYREQGFIDPEEVVKRAKKKSSALHDYFEWDDTKAAIKHRIEQAKFLIRKVNITYIKGEKKEIRAFVSSTQTSSDKTKSYVPTIVAMKDPEMREEILERGYYELESWTKRYDTFQEFVGVVNEFKRLDL